MLLKSKPLPLLGVPNEYIHVLYYMYVRVDTGMDIRKDDAASLKVYVHTCMYMYVHVNVRVCVYVYGKVHVVPAFD